MVLRGEDAISIWSRQLLDGIEASPVTGNGAVYVAGLDQHVRAYEVSTGRPLWHYLTESKLTDSPTLMGNFVYQQIPTEGLVCFEAWPRNTVRGKVVWTAPVTGNVVNNYRNQLVVWDQVGHRLAMVHPDRGAVVEELSLPAVDILRFSRQRNGEVFAASNDGRLIHLIPR